MEPEQHKYIMYRKDFWSTARNTEQEENQYVHWKPDISSVIVWMLEQLS